MANADWVNFPGTPAGTAAVGLQLNPTGGTRRDSAGSRIGIISAGNFPGTTGDNPYTGTPADVKVDYFRVTPDNCPTGRGPDGADDDRHGGAGGPERPGRLVHDGRQRHPRG